MATRSQLNAGPCLILVTALIALACSSTDVGSTRYLGTPTTQQGPLGKNTTNVTVTNPSGGVMIDTAADTSVVSAVAQPFAIAAADASGRATAAANMENGPMLMFGTDATGIDITTTSGDNFGMDLTVHLPNPFHGLLTVTATQGNLTYLAAPNSPGAVLNVGTGDVDVENVGNQLTIQVGTGNIVLVTAGTLSGPDSSGNPQPPSLVTTNYGNITAKIPDAASLTINARTVKNGVVRAQADQVVVQQAPDGKSAQITIGDGMSGVINMGTGDGDIVFLRP